MNKKQIEQAMLGIKYGDIVIFKEPVEGRFIGIGGSGKDYDGNYRDSGWCGSIKGVLQYIGYGCGYTQKQLKEHLKTWKYIKSIPWALSDSIPEGTKVLISDNAEDECEKFDIWDDEMEEIVGKVCEIKRDYGGDCRIWNEDKSKWWNLPRQAFTIAVEEEEETDEMKNAMDLLKENGYKIIKE